jgi:replicative superfamily II helicase
MVDFKKKLGPSAGKQPLDPRDIYDRLDRESDKGPLRPAQVAVLEHWHGRCRNDKDVIVKLHTGQGKTLIGLLILQSKLNEDVGPALYLCPNNFLVEQTAKQAEQFGFNCCTATGSDDLPAEFLASKAILITSVYKLFNGITKFGLHARSTKVGALVIDDVHACIDAIRDSSAIRLDSGSGAYSELLTLFASGLESQGHGTYADLTNGEFAALLPVPYWDWIDHVTDVARILSKHSETKAIRFAWPLIKDMLTDCECLVSGTSLEIFPRLVPVADFQSYHRALHRVFMSATVSDDSFLVKGLGLSVETIKTPVTFAGEAWSGEKMVLIPSLLAPTLERSTIVERFARPSKNERKFGVVALVPSFANAKDWKAYGAEVVDKDSIDSGVERLRSGHGEIPLVIANRYDGIDLPDSACRILILDSRPRGESLCDRYQEMCLSNTEVIAAKTARAIEQGMGRSVRGEKDFSVVLLIGPDLVNFVRAPDSREFLSDQTRQQMEIGLSITDFAKDEIEKGEQPMNAVISLVNQCLKRDVGWKEYYVERMNQVMVRAANPTRLEVFAVELLAEQRAREGRFEDASSAVQEIADRHAASNAEKGWFLQEAARHLYRASKVDSEALQATAHRKNRFLLRPRTRAGVELRLQVERRRVETIIDWMRSHSDGSALALSIDSLLSDLRFGVSAERFEAAFDQLGNVLGFACERPDKEWKEGPDNLWMLRDNLGLLVECKSEVALDRAEIHKRETDQMNRSAAWFTKAHPGVTAQCVIVIPPKRLAPGAAVLQPTRGLNKKGLDKLASNVRLFFAEFAAQDLKTLSARNLQTALERHQLEVTNLLEVYTEGLKEAGLPRR